MVELIVFVVAFAARLAPVLASGGLGGNFSYDPGVYYAAADALTFGRLPYRDFVLLHPPGIMLALSPFAALGRITSDHTGFMAAQVGFMLLGAVNAVLVVRVARRFAVPSGAALTGGLFYAVWLGSVNAEDVARLGALGAFAFLCGLLAVSSARPAGARTRFLLAGLAFGAAASTKIWWAAPVLVVLGWHALGPERRGRALPLASGILLALLVIDGPFFVAAPQAMWHMVVTEQLGRPARDASALARLGGLTGITQFDPHPAGVAVIAAGCALAIVLALAQRVRAARPVVLVALVQVAVLFLAPPWYGFYSDYLAPTVAVCVAAAGAPIAAGARLPRVRRAAVLTPALCTVLAALGTARYTVADRPGPIRPFAAGALPTAVEHIRCVTSNSAMGLILIDSFSRDLRDGCPEWVDVTGRKYGIAPGARTGAPRMDHVQWHQALRSYLYSGGAVILVPDSGSSVGLRTLAGLRRAGVLARAGRQTVYRVPPHGPPAGTVGGDGGGARLIASAFRAGANGP